jgi:signal transduction histidine kinase
VTCWLVAGGWMTAAASLGLAVVCRRRLVHRLDHVAQACHEVRGPLAAVRLGLGLGERVGDLSPQQLRALDRELERAVCALADLEAVRRGGPAFRLDARPVDVQALLADLASAWDAVAAAGGTELRLGWSGPPATVCGDPVRLAQALGNLIANAIEHGVGPVEIRGSHAGECVRIEVWDRGPGLPAPLTELVRGRRRGERGHGLGIARSLVAAHGGRLSSAPSATGARLVLTLPMGERLPAERAASE